MSCVSSVLLYTHVEAGTTYIHVSLCKSMTSCYPFIVQRSSEQVNAPKQCSLRLYPSYTHTHRTDTLWDSWSGSPVPCDIIPWSYTLNLPRVMLSLQYIMYSVQPTTVLGLHLANYPDITLLSPLVMLWFPARWVSANMIKRRGGPPVGVTRPRCHLTVRPTDNVCFS